MQITEERTVKCEHCQETYRNIERAEGMPSTHWSLPAVDGQSYEKKRKKIQGHVNLVKDKYVPSKPCANNSRYVSWKKKNKTAHRAKTTITTEKHGGGSITH